MECSVTNGGISVPVKQKGTFTCMYMIDVVEFNHDPTHDDVIKLKHFTRYWPFVRGIHRSPVNSPHKGQWRGALMFSLICAWINGWVNNGEAADLRRHRTHYDVIVMTLLTLKRKSQVKWPHPKWCWGLLIKYTKLANVGTMSTIDTSKVYLYGIISPQLEPYWKRLTPQIIIELWRPDYAVRHITFDRVELMICQRKVLVWAPEQRNRHRPDPATPPFLAATKQLYDWFSPSVCPSVTPFSPCSHHRIIMKFSGVITNDKSDVHAKGQGQGSKVKVTEVNTQLNRFRTVTLVWIHIWWWNDAYSLMMLRRGALLFFKVIRQISRSHGSKKCRIWPRLGVSGL